MIALIALAMFVYLSYFGKKEESRKEDNSSLYQKVINLPKPIIKKDDNVDVYQETTVLEVKPSKYILASEAEDYKQATKLKIKEANLSTYKPICKSVNRKKIRKRVFHDGIKRIAIIMDDIGNINQVRKLKSLNLPITPSIFPSTKRHPNTPKFAKQFKCYMVHVPMEALSYKRVEENTLKVTDTFKLIHKRVAAIHKDFPNAVAINNHTGSKFTTDIGAMDRLFCALDKYGIRFIDSKTAPHSLGKKMQKLHQCYVYSRDIFLDNKPDVDYILDQLALTVKRAKKYGLAIAICHPRKSTFEALKLAKPLFEGVKLIYINKLYR